MFARADGWSQRRPSERQRDRRASGVRTRASHTLSHAPPCGARVQLHCSGARTTVARSPRCATPAPPVLAVPARAASCLPEHPCTAPPPAVSTDFSFSTPSTQPPLRLETFCCSICRVPTSEDAAALTKRKPELNHRAARG
eukprot:350214-Chlamydomonas_euryale.AAC.3